MSWLRSTLLALAVLLAPAIAAASQPPDTASPPGAGVIEPRAILALYDSRATPNVRKTRAHQYAAAPLNHLGLTVRFWDLAKGLPDANAMAGVRGVLAWLYEDSPQDARAYLDWAAAVIDAGYRFALIGNIAGAASETADPETYAAAKRLARKLGVALGDRFVAFPYRATYSVYNRSMVGFEWDVAKDPTPFQEAATLPGATAHLTANAGGPSAETAALVVTGPNGAFVQSGYDIRLASSDDRTRWILDPFAFFAAAFASDDLPKPDVTTLSGRRIYYSHIDGDGWRSLSTADGYREHPTPAADVVFQRAIEPYPDLPVTVAPIVADLDSRWFGTEAALESARRIFAAPQVEAAHHTYTHPFAWGFFEHYDWDLEREIAGAGGFGARRAANGAARTENDPLYGYDSARAYAIRPFDLEQEIEGARAFVQALLPPGKKVELVQWSGDTSPFRAALEATTRAGLLNINGGDSRFDPEYPTVATVAPIGIQFDGVRQIYASASNENTYTELWTRRFYGFRYLGETLRRTESPRRLMPHNVYYHMYSGAKSAALKALIDNLDEAVAAELAPVTTSRYVRIAEGFFDTRLERLGSGHWRIHDRGALQTLRFTGETMAPDYQQSVGVIGHRVHNGDLYVALDAAVATPEILLKPKAPAALPYLAHARWDIAQFARRQDGFGFKAQGFGAGAFAWGGVPDGVYRIVATSGPDDVWQGEARADGAGGLAFTVAADAIDGLDIQVTRRSFAQLEQAR